MRSMLAAAAAIAVLGSSQPGKSTQDPDLSIANDGITILVEPSHQPEFVPPFEGTAPAPQTPAPSLKGDSTVKARPAAAPTVKVASPPEIIGDSDSRHPEPGHVLPGRAMVYIRSDLEVCSGWLYGPDIVATAGHCVNDGYGRWASLKDVVVTPALHGQESHAASAPFRSCGAVRLYSNVGWTSSRHEAHDYGAIKLDCRVGETTGWLGYGWTTGSLLGKAMVLPGYVDVANEAAGCRGFGKFIRLCAGPGRVMAESSGLLFYDADTKLGASGGPVLGLGSCAPCVLAIHAKSKHGGSGSHGQWNHGPIVTRKVFANLRAWQRAK